MENRNGLIVGADLTQANGLAERQAAQRMIVRHVPGARRLTLGADKAYDTRDFVSDLRQLNVTPHVAPLRHRRAHDAACSLRREPAEEKAHRSIVRLGQDDRRISPALASRCRQAPLQVHADHGGL